MTVRLLRRLCCTMDWKKTDDLHHVVQKVKSELHEAVPVLHVDIYSEFGSLLTHCSGSCWIILLRIGGCHTWALVLPLDCWWFMHLYCWSWAGWSPKWVVVQEIESGSPSWKTVIFVMIQTSYALKLHATPWEIVVPPPLDVFSNSNPQSQAWRVHRLGNLSVSGHDTEEAVILDLMPNPGRGGYIPH